jgi:hypothetical protein
MSEITFQDGKVLFRDGKVGTEQACCCGECAPCPDLQSLCISITLTDYNGTVYTADETDVFWFMSGDSISGSVNFPNFDYSLLLRCENGNISVFAGWAFVIAGCICTSGGGSAVIPCSSDPKWYLATASGEIEFDQFGDPCDGDCPPNLGSFSVTFSDAPC